MAPTIRNAGLLALTTWFFLTLLLSVEAIAQPAPIPIEVKSRCYDCHLNPMPPEGSKRGPYIDQETYKRSVHGDQRCESCHRSIVELPHEEHLPAVECRDCHRVDNVVGAPKLPSYREYEQSVHGRLVAAGDPKAPRCQNCHGHHDILRPTETNSHVNRMRIAETCGVCHSKIEETYKRSSHSRALFAGNMNAPVCTDCHGEHSIDRPGEESSSASRQHVVGTCAACHEDIARMKISGVETDAVETFRESYHGVAAKFGSTSTAVCVDCHGHHEVLGHDDPRSTIHPSNIPKTCGRSGCHAGAGPGFARGKVHVSAHSIEDVSAFEEGRDRTFAKAFRIVELAFIFLTTSVIFGMILYMALDLFHRWVLRRRLWIRYFAVATVPLLATFWAVYKVTIFFIDKLKA